MNGTVNTGSSKAQSFFDGRQTPDIWHTVHAGVKNAPSTVI